MNTTEPGMVAPRFSYGVGSKVTPQSNIGTNTGDELPSLTAFNRIIEHIRFGVELTMAGRQG